MTEKLIKNKNGISNNNEHTKPAKEDKKVEISEKAQQERLFLSGLLIQQTENLVKEAKKRKKKIEEELFELRSGEKISIKKINAIVNGSKNHYGSMFPNDNPFFKEIYRLYKWDHLNPNDFFKPAEVAVLINEIIYGRFNREVLSAIHILNPYIGFCVRGHKNYQFLTKEGIELLKKYREEAIDIMRTCSTIHEFRVKYFAAYGIPFQGSLFEKNN